MKADGIGQPMATGWKAPKTAYSKAKSSSAKTLTGSGSGDFLFYIQGVEKTCAKEPKVAVAGDDCFTYSSRLCMSI